MHWTPRLPSPPFWVSRGSPSQGGAQPGEPRAIGTGDAEEAWGPLLLEASLCPPPAAPCARGVPAASAFRTPVSSHSCIKLRAPSRPQGNEGLSFVLNNK